MWIIGTIAGGRYPGRLKNATSALPHAKKAVPPVIYQRQGGCCRVADGRGQGRNECEKRAMPVSVKITPIAQELAWCLRRQMD